MRLLPKSELTFVEMGDDILLFNKKNGDTHCLKGMKAYIFSLLSCRSEISALDLEHHAASEYEELSEMEVTNLSDHKQLSEQVNKAVKHLVEIRVVEELN